MINPTDFPMANGRKTALRSVGEALDQIERCAELVGDHQEVQALLDSAADTLRRTLRDLRQEFSPLGDVLLDGRQMRASLMRMAAFTRKVLGVALDAFLDESLDGLLSPAQASNVLLVVRDALENAILHAGATRIALRAQVENQKLVVRLTDDGAGFDVRAAREPRDGGGLQTMWRLADAARGLLSIESAPGAGTIVTITVPLRLQQGRLST